MRHRLLFHRTLAAVVCVVQLMTVPVFAQRADDRFYRPWNVPPEDVPTSFRRGGESPTSTNPSPTQRFPTPSLQGDGAASVLDPSGLVYQIHLVGEVARPGTYRVAASDRLQEVLQRAGGTSPQGSLRFIEIRQKGARRVYDLLRFQLEGELRQNPFLQDNDVVFVPLRKSAVQVVGSVKRPNMYELRGERFLSEVFALAGGTTVGAATKDPIRLIRYIDGEKKVFEIPYNPEQLRTTEIQNGDVVYIPNILSANREFDYNIARLPGDQIFYPSYEDRVFVFGGVNSPGPYPFNPYATVSQYLTFAGGTTKLAKVNRLQIISMAGEKRHMRPGKEFSINPGDTIYIPEPRIAPEGWLGIITGLAGFGLSATATILTLSR